MPQRRVAVVLGAGGIVGVSYLTGALAALEDVAGFDAREADLVVGTSAGSVAGALLRSGLSASALHRAEVPLSLADGGPVDLAFQRAFSNPIDMARRAAGSVLTAGRAFGVMPPVPRALRKLIPSGLFTLRRVAELLEPVLAGSWPDGLRLVACEVGTRRRGAIGGASAPGVSRSVGVRASCAIPGFYESVTVNGREFVDGGVLSTTHVDLAAGYDLVVCIAPMSYDRHSARPAIHPARLAMELYRLYPTRTLRSEVHKARAAGSRVLVVRPTVFEAQRHGFNLMERKSRRKVADKAYKTVAASLAGGKLGAALAEFGYGGSRRSA